MPKPNSGEYDDNPGSLYTGSSSRMFDNEKLADKNRKVREIEAKRQSLPKGVRGIVNDLQGILNAAQVENDSVGSYLRSMAEPGKKPNPEDIMIEFRAREMNLQLIKRIQTCLDKYRMPNQM